jgi:Protein of unknown function (DUF4239)
MSLTVALAIILVCTLLSGMVSTLVHHRVHVDIRRRHQEVGTAIFLQLGVIFAVLLAFVFSEVWSDYNAAASSIELECSALEGAAVLASALPPAQALPVLKAEQAYVDGVIHEEWPLMFSARSENVDVDDMLHTAIVTTARLHPADAADLGLRQQILAYLEQAHTQRTIRTFQLGSGVPTFLWGLLITFGVVLAVFVSMAGVESGRALASFSVTFAAAVAAILVLIHLLDYPFEGALALPPGHFVYTLQKITELAQAVR